MVDTIVNLQFNGNDLYNTDGSIYGTYSGNLVVDYTTVTVHTLWSRESESLAV